MKRPRLPFLLLGLACALTAGAQSPTLGNRLRLAVLQADEARIYTILQGQTGALADLMTDDCLYTHSNGRVQTREQFVDALAAGELKYTSIRYEQAPLVRIYHGNTGVLTGHARVEVETRAAGKISLNLVVTSVYVVSGNQWKLASYHSAVAPPAQP